MSVREISHPNGTILIAECREALRRRPAKSIHCGVTSPPYWGLRDYGIAPTDWPEIEYTPMTGLPPMTVPAWQGVLGLEPTPEMFVAHIVDVFREVYRVLRDDGTLWLNLGDSWCGSNCGGCTGGHSTLEGNAGYQNHSKAAKKSFRRNGEQVSPRSHSHKTGPGLKPKDLIGIPWRVALALQADGWWLRSEIIWHKPNAMPLSVRDRPSPNHEQIFLLTKSRKYFYDREAIMEKVSGGAHPHGSGSRQKQADPGNGIKSNSSFNSYLINPTTADMPEKRNKRTVWKIPTQGYKEAHYATFPPRLITPPILAGCPYDCCSKCGTGWRRITKSIRRPTRPGENTKIKIPGGWDTAAGDHGTIHRNGRTEAQYLDRAVTGNRDPQRHVTETITIGWEPSCKCGYCFRPVRGVVIDLFGGSGTTAQVAADLGRTFVLIEQNPEDLKRIRKRIQQPVLC